MRALSRLSCTAVLDWQTKGPTYKGRMEEREAIRGLDRADGGLILSSGDFAGEDVMSPDRHRQTLF